MRRLPTLLLAVIAAAAVAAAALADPLDPKVRLTDADQAAAAAALLQRTDLGPAWSGGASKTPSSLKAPVCPSLRPNFSKLTITGHAESVFTNGNGGYQVTSDVEVWKTVEQARQHLAAMLQPALPKCIKFSLLKSLGGSNAILLPVKRQDFPKLADVSVHFRAPVGYKVGRRTVTVLSDFVFLRKGRTEIYLNVVAPSTDEDQLTALERRIAKALLERVRT